jgi:hypothetical protein
MAKIYTEIKKGTLAVPFSRRPFDPTEIIKTWAAPKMATPQQISLKRPVFASTIQPKRRGRE